MLINILSNLLEYMVLAWCIAKMDPLQNFFEWWAEHSAIFNTLFFPLVSCQMCLTFWIVLTGSLMQWSVPDFLSHACACALCIYVITTKRV